jgi:2-phospho-L-lactate guanylyltransferase
MTRRLVAIPIKDPAEAKTRLSSHLTPLGRAALALHLLGQTIARLRQAQALGATFDIAIVSTSERIRHCARRDGLPTVTDLGLGLSAAAASARAWAEEQLYDALCLLPGDLADPSPDDLCRLMQQPVGMSVTLCPALDFGTNALLMPLPNRMAFAYGAGSYHGHLRATLEAGLEPRTLTLPSLRRDVDTATDLPFLSQAARIACHFEISGRSDP